MNGVRLYQCSACKRQIAKNNAPLRCYCGGYFTWGGKIQNERQKGAVEAITNPSTIEDVKSAMVEAKSCACCNRRSTCVRLCPEAERYVSQDHVTLREQLFNPLDRSFHNAPTIWRSEGE